MKNLNQYIYEKEELNQTDEDFLMFSLYQIVRGEGSISVKDNVIKIEIRKEYKKDILDICKRDGFEVLKCGSVGKGYSGIEIKRDPAKQIKKYNLN